MVDNPDDPMPQGNKPREEMSEEEKLAYDRKLFAWARRRAEEQEDRDRLAGKPPKTAKDLLRMHEEFTARQKAKGIVYQKIKGDPY